MKALFGPYLFGKKGLVKSHILDTQPLVLLYFSSSTWFPCKKFTPILIDFYNEVNTPKKQAEIVLIPWDRTEWEWIDSSEKMPWLSVSLGDLPLKRFLSEKYKVLTSPTLVLIDKYGNSLNTNCRWEVEQKGVEALKGWQELVAKAQIK